LGAVGCVIDAFKKENIDVCEDDEAK